MPIETRSALRAGIRSSGMLSPFRAALPGRDHGPERTT
jgi:hypothetical protein